jgi:hypothetical protein
MRKTLALLVAASALALQAASAAVTTLEAARELVAAADIDLDGRSDLAIVDKKDGTIRVAFASANGTYTHLGPVVVARALTSTSDAATGFSLGRFSSGAPAWGAIASPADGVLRILSLDKSSPASFGRTSLSPFALGSIGPSKLSALTLNASGAITNRDGILLGSIENGGSNPGALENIKITGPSSLTSHNKTSYSDYILPLSINPVPYDRTQLTRPHAGVMTGTPYGNSTLHIHRVSFNPASANSPAASQEIPASHRQFVTGFFGPSLSPQILVFNEGSQMVYAYPLGGGSTPSIGAVFYRNFPNPVRTVSVVRGNGTDSDRLLVTFQYGPVGAGLYDYNGTDFPTAFKEFERPSGSDFVNGVGLDNGEFFLLEGDSTTGVSTRFSRHDFKGILIDSSTFPAAQPLAPRGNVVFYSDTPLSNPAARVVSLKTSGDWSGNAPTVKPLPGPVTVTKETFRGESLGLGSPVVDTLGTAPTGANGVLANQFDSNISAFNFGPALGDVADIVSFSPAGGTFQSAIALEITSARNAELAASGSNATRDIYYRIDTSSPGSWVLYDPENPPHLAYNANVLAFSVPKSTGIQSPIARAQFQFQNSGSLDSDNDGVPDHVEIGSGLDPSAGTDTDGDGDSDLSELYAGTDPADASDNLGRLASGARPAGLDALLGTFNLTVRPSTRFDDAGNKTTAVPASDVVISAQTLSGGLLGTGKTISIGSASSAYLNNLTAPEILPYFTVSSPANYALSGFAGHGGREVAAIVPVPSVEASLPSDYFSGYDSPATAAANWVSSLRASFLPTSGSFRLTRGGTSNAIASNATASTVRTILNAMNSGTGIFGGGNATVTGTMPRFSVSAPTAATLSANSVTSISALSPSSTVNIIPTQDSNGATPVEFDILVLPAPETFTANASVSETLLTLLVEKKLGTLLGTSNATLLPLRAADISRTAISPDQILALENAHPSASYLLEEIVESIRETLFAPSPSTEILSLREVANSIYEFSSAQTGPGPVPDASVIADFLAGNLTAENTPAAMPAPIDALRGFLENGTISPTYTTQPAAGVLANATSAVATLLGAPQPRSTFTGILRVNYGGMLQADGLSSGPGYKLFDRLGNPYSFDASITLRPGTRLNVTAYNDIAVEGIFETALEVISISIASLPEFLGSDSDNNLLADDWEEAFHGGIGLDPYSTAAGGKTLVQLYLDGADPLLGSATALADLFPRQLAVQAAAGGNFTMTWKFPAAYVEHFNFDLQSTANLATAFADEYTTATPQTSGDNNTLPLGAPGTARKFWRLKLELHRSGTMVY